MSQGITSFPELLTLNQATCTSASGTTTGFSVAQSAILISDTTHVENNPKSLKVSTPGNVVNEGAYIGSVLNTIISKPHKGIARIYAPAGANLIFKLYQSGNTGSAVLTWAADGFQTLTIPDYISNNSSGCALYVYTNVKQAVDFWINALSVKRTK